MATVAETRELFRRADAVCFNVDSTVIRKEGIDELAKFCGVGDAVTEMTRKAMGGSVTFKTALRERLSIIKYSREQVNKLITDHPLSSHQGLCTSEMCIAQCSRCVGMSLTPMAVVCMLANVLLLIPDLNYRYLIEHHVTKEAVWCSGIWASGFLVLVAVRGFASHSDHKGCCYFRAQMLCRFGYTCLALLAAGFCFMVSGTGLALGPLCLHNGTDGLKWERPLKQVKQRERLYLYEPERWTSACEEPRGVVTWNVVLFSVQMAASGLQLIFCVVHLLTAILGVICGPNFCRNKVVHA